MGLERRTGVNTRKGQRGEGKGHYAAGPWGEGTSEWVGDSRRENIWSQRSGEYYFNPRSHPQPRSPRKTTTPRFSTSVKKS